MDIIMTGYVAEKGTHILAGMYEQDNEERIPHSIIKRARDMYRPQRQSDLEDILTKMNLVYYGVSKGGIYKALWDMAQSEGVGLRIYRQDISIRQETVELCEHYDLNPYMLNGEGSFLIITECPSSVVKELNNLGIHARIIGYTCSGKDRIIINGDERRYIESRIKDELEGIV